MDLKPIETVYHGHRFRSRLEARWAVFLEACGLAFDYEVEGYDLDGVWYLPDFWVHPQLSEDEPNYERIPGFWLEVKGPDMLRGDEAWVKAERLADASGDPVYVFTGQIDIYQKGLRFAGSEPLTVRWLTCPFCGAIEPETDYTRMTCMCVGGYEAHSPSYLAAQKAKQARFEHGSRGR